MYLITIVILAVLNLKGVEPGSVLGCFGNFCEKDATTEANDLFREMKTPEDGEMAFDAARRALDQLKLNPEGKEDVITILQGYLDLKDVPGSLQSSTMDCDNVSLIDQFYELHELMSTHTAKYKSSLSRFHLSSNLNNLRGAYLDRCANTFRSQFDEMMETIDRIVVGGIELGPAFKLMSYFSFLLGGSGPPVLVYIRGFVSGKYLKTVRDEKRWSHLYSALKLLAPLWDYLARDTIDSGEIVTEGLFERSCDAIEKYEPFTMLADTLLKIMRMKDWPRKEFFYDEPIIVDFQVCLEARKVFLSKELDIHKNEVLAKTSGNQD